MNNNLKIVFFGTPEFAVKSLDSIIKAGFNVAAVVTMPDKMAGRGHKLLESDVKKYALAHNLKILQPEKLKDPAFITELKQLQADLFVVIAFRMLPEIVWSMPPLGTFNLHASLLPKYRGAAPINRAIMNGEKESGVTTFFLKHEIDTGDIIEQKRIDILPEDDAGSLHDKLMELGAEMVVNTLRQIQNEKVTPSPQPEGEHIPAPKIFKETCHIDWNMEAEKIHNLVRGLSPYPGAWTNYFLAGNDKEPVEIKIFRTSIPQDNELSPLNPGEILLLKNRLIVGTGSGLIEILSLQPSGKKRMETEAFLRGYNPICFK